MAKKTSVELPLGNAPGVGSLVVPMLDTLVDKYEKAKERAELVSPDVKEAKENLILELSARREQLPLNGDGKRFYRREGIDYIMSETLKVHKAEEETFGPE